MPYDWHDGVTLAIDVSTAGDYVAYGTTTDYPFQGGGTNAPLGWTLDLGSGGVIGDVNITVADGRWSISNKTAGPLNGKYYGAYRDFPAKANHIYVVRHQHRTMDGKVDGTYNNTIFRLPPYSSNILATVVPTSQQWGNISLPIQLGSSDTTFRISLQFDYYDTVNNQANWGAQWQGLSITEIPPTVPEPTWKDITCDVRAITYRYGRERFTNRYEVATCAITVLNNDGEYSYRPDRTLRPGRFVRVRGLAHGYSYWGQFYGIIDSITDGYTIDGKVVTVLNCYDMSSLLSNVNVATATAMSSYYVSSTRFLLLARSAGWPNSKVDSTNGSFIQQPILANGRTVRDELGLIADSEGGAFYCDRTGMLVYRGRDYLASSSSLNQVKAELLAMPWDGGGLPVVDNIPDYGIKRIIPTNELITDWSRDRVINEVTVANQGGSATVVRDLNSQAKYGPRTYQRLDLLNDNSHPEYLTTRANDIMTGYTESVQRVNRISWRPELEGSADKWALEMFLGELVRVRYQHPTEGWGYAVVSRIQGYEHSFDLTDWKVTVSLDDIVAFNYWLHPPSPIGWDVSLWDVGRWDETTGEGAFWTRGFVWGAVAGNAAVGKWGY